ncbi:MAG: LmbE family protein [uncultured bacterium]|nr:MAG: LmbE family protein [uncultured bacterium]
MAINPHGEKMMVVYAHADDAEIWSGGTIARWNSLGGTSKILCFSTDKIRIEEAKAGASVLGSDISVIEKDPTKTGETIALVEAQIREFNPGILITHYYQDSHPEHRNVFEIVSNAIIQNRINAGNPKYLLSANSYNEICLDGVFEPNVYIDITDNFDIKLKAIEQHKSQPFEMWKKLATDQNTLLGSRISGTKFVEGFVQVPILGKLSILTLF